MCAEDEFVDVLTMTNHMASSIISSLFVVMILGGVQLMKAELAATRPGTLIAGILCSVIFVFVLTAVSNMQMASVGDGARAGLLEVVICMLLAMIAAATVHRVSVTVCLLLCIFFAFILSNVAHTRYSVPVVQQSIAVKKKK
uniref:Dolichyl-diphosphooligosaccharide--protein glycosyltransferase subunit KCP2 n=1 Tax=Ascaris lumbricoides TaxID=6252 RepID=A0A0M3HQC3_ASCLU